MQNLNSNYEFEHVRATAESARMITDRLYRDMKGLDAKVTRHGRHGLWSTLAVVLLFALAGAGAWWLNSELKAQGTSIAKVFGLQQTVDSLSQRMIGAETALGAIPAELKKVTGRVDALDKKVSAVQKIAMAKPAAAAPTTPSELAAPVNAALQSNIEQLNTHIASLQLQHETDAAQMESLRTELASLRKDTDQKLENVKQSIPRDTGPDVVNLQAAVDRHQSRIASIANEIDRDRMDFEVREDHAIEVAPGVLLTIKDTNVGRQEINGWIYLQNEHRFVYLKNHGLLEPITVYGVFDKQARDIVITRVRKSDAIGYVLSPKTSPTAPATLAAGN